ncbi:MAG: ATP-binding protein [Verrucomicrobiales bacterium]|jgi:DNA helicase HerA-like ATPase|nr:ATP-binding protein [Verrucomicrobiales bacterium]
MSIFKYKDNEVLGKVKSVDTAIVIVHVADVDRLRQLQVNRLAVLQSSRPGQHLIGIIQKITRNVIEAKEMDEVDSDNLDLESKPELNLVRIALIGTMVDKLGEQSNVFLRTLETVPEIDANCFAVEGKQLTDFMRIVANISADGEKLSLGHYTLDDKAEAFLNGNKFFQRHAIIVGSTGSGKSWTTARILECVSTLPNANSLVFDIHGEYRPLKGEGIRHLRIAGPKDLDLKRGLKDGVIFLPYWLLAYEAMVSMFVDRSDQNAPNQAMLMSRTIIEAKRSYLTKNGHKDVLENFTIDSPVPFSIKDVISGLECFDVEMTTGSSGREKQGTFHGKLSRLIERLQNKQTDRRLGFLFQAPAETMQFDWLDKLVSILVAGSKDQSDGLGGVKIVDFSEVPSDMLPLIISLVARLVFSIQQWTPSDQRHPIALFCDEAHLYIPERQSSSAGESFAVSAFERIAKEGRKYGVGLVVISQRPSEVNRTVLSQCNNLVAMRLTNGDDQTVVRRLLPDSLGGFSDLLPVLDTGEALVVGDASLLPTRVRVQRPTNEPDSGTVPFWDRWSENKKIINVSASVDNWRKQAVQRSAEKKK